MAYLWHCIFDGVQEKGGLESGQLTGQLFTGVVVVVVTGQFNHLYYYNSIRDGDLLLIYFNINLGKLLINSSCRRCPFGGRERKVLLLLLGYGNSHFLLRA